MSFPLTPVDYAQPAPSSDRLVRVTVALAALSWLTVVAALFWR